jgi:uncharacterized protein YndB with AHSA1/START domain
MNSIERADSIALEAPPQRVFPLLLDLEGYSRWWPAQIRFELFGPFPARVGTQIRISNGPLVKWTATIQEIVPNQLIRFKYSDGAWDGTAEWILVPKNSGSEVTYKISILPGQGWLKFLGKLLNLGELHSKEMEKILQNLKNKLQ